MEPVQQARQLVRHHIPDALAAILGGSAASGRATASSDLDIAVLIPDGGETRRETVRFDRRVAELFVHTRAGLAEVFAASIAQRRATMQHIYADGLVLLDTDGSVEHLRAQAETDLRNGPPPLPPEAVESKRYGLTDALDDLADTTDPAERLAVAAIVLNSAADLLFDHHRAWTGTGKWLPRRLRAATPDHGHALLAAHLHLCTTGDAAPFLATASAILTLTGGPLREGYRRTWR